MRSGPHWVDKRNGHDFLAAMHLRGGALSLLPPNSLILLPHSPSPARLQGGKDF